MDTARPELSQSDRGLDAAAGAMAQDVRARAPRGTVARTRCERDPRVARTGIEGVRVLVVDDHADLRDMFAVALGQLGAVVTTAASATRAVEVFGQTAPDAIVCDIFLPEHDGYWVVRQVRSSEVGHTPAIAVTGYDSEEGRAEAADAGFDVQMVKPIEIDDLAEMIARLHKGAAGGSNRVRERIRHRVPAARGRDSSERRLRDPLAYATHRRI